MESFNKLIDIVSKLRSEDGCPWDREQTHKSLKAACIEEAVEVIAGIDILEETGNPESLKEELGDLLLQVVMHAQIAQEEGLFTIDDVIKGIIGKRVSPQAGVLFRTAPQGLFSLKAIALAIEDTMKRIAYSCTEQIFAKKHDQLLMVVINLILR